MLWDTVKESLRGILSESEYSLWINPLECCPEDSHNLALIAPDRFFCAWVEDRYLEMIRQKALELDPAVRVRMQVNGPRTQAMDPGENGQYRLPGLHDCVQRLRSLHPAFTFDQFMVGESNLLARSACKALASGDDTFGNCLFMNSSTGLGKSHLTQAVVHQVLQSAPSIRLHYLSAQQFSAEMVKGLRTQAMEQFSRKYLHHCDMLLVEDIHILKGKTKTQEELNIILDYLIKSGRRVILTSALAPTRLEGIDEDFRSRMSSGLVTGIESPDYETRARIIRHKLGIHGLPVDEDLVGFMAEKLHGDVRRMESAIIGIKAKACLLQAPPDLHIAREVIEGLIGPAAGLTGEGIRDFIGRQFNVSAEDLRSRSRKRSIAFPRQMAMYLTRKYTRISLSEIGSIYNRDHSTVLHAIKNITRDMTREVSVREQVARLCADLQK